MEAFKYVISACFQFLSIQINFLGYHFSLLSIFILVCIASIIGYIIYSLS